MTVTTPNDSARKFATRIRDIVDFDGDINLHELKGKYIEYVDLQSRLMTRRVIKVSKETVKVIDVVKKKHTVRHEHILWAFPRRGDPKKLKVNL